MEEAPTPIVKKVFQEPININDLKDKVEYIHNKNTIIMGLYNENIIFIYENNENSFQASKNYEQITEEIPTFKSSKNIDSIFILLNRLFKSDKYEIKKDDENKIFESKC